MHRSEELDLQDYDLIISSSSSFAKAVKKRPGSSRHVCFCHNVTRFLWDTQTYLREYGDYRYFYPIIEIIFRSMRKIDITYVQKPDFSLGNSNVLACRIQET